MCWCHPLNMAFISVGFSVTLIILAVESQYRRMNSLQFRQRRHCRRRPPGDRPRGGGGGAPGSGGPAGGGGRAAEEEGGPPQGRAGPPGRPRAGGVTGPAGGAEEAGGEGGGDEEVRSPEIAEERERLLPADSEGGWGGRGQCGGGCEGYEGERGRGSGVEGRGDEPEGEGGGVARRGTAVRIQDAQGIPAPRGGRGSEHVAAEPRNGDGWHGAWRGRRRGKRRVRYEVHGRPREVAPEGGAFGSGRARVRDEGGILEQSPRETKESRCCPGAPSPPRNPGREGGRRWDRPVRTPLVLLIVQVQEVQVRHQPPVEPVPDS
mmetsp:Transcript_21964/g.64911  ORF Transcript_21964/g.64911 Transcript_21964/m.64911 type:complete len:320 (-) Transcript_21964:839-1798(-)